MMSGRRWYFIDASNNNPSFSTNLRLTSTTGDLQVLSCLMKSAVRVRNKATIQMLLDQNKVPHITLIGKKVDAFPSQDRHCFGESWITTVV